MEIKQVRQFHSDSIEQLLAAIPFYKTVRRQDPWQFDVLLQHSRIVEFTPGEVVLQRGDGDSWLYFLLKGQLAVYASDECDLDVVNYITPGEVFGDLSMLVEQQRTATVIADPNCKQVMVFSTDFKVFGALEDTAVISLQTKLAYYANTVHNLRWKLEVYRMKYPHCEQASRHRQVRLYSGTKGTMDELHALYQQARALARLLLGWNQEFGALTLGAPNLPSSELLEAAES